MKQCLSCNAVASDDATACPDCGKSLTHYRPVRAHAQTVHGPTESALRFLGSVFYLAAAANVVWAIFVANENIAAIVVPLAGAISALFFGGISFAADDIRHSLRIIETKLSAPNQTNELLDH